jgi:succinate dehydrogenase / fumarate reductase membrane anchor subunit
MSKQPSLRTPLSRVRHLGSAHSGTQHFWRQRVTSVASVPLTIAAVIIIIALFGRNHAAVIQILASPFVTITMALFIFVNVYHMWLGMQVIVEDYLHDEFMKVTVLMANTFFCCVVGVASIYALLKLSFGV